MMTYNTQPSSYYYDHSSVLPKGTNSKQSQLSDQRYYGSPSTSNSHSSFAVNGSASHPRTLPPYINVQRASEPASPATIATTISSHSTPSPSPSRNSHIANTAPSSDFTLFDDAIMSAAQDLRNNTGKGRTAVDVASTMADSGSGMSHYTTSGFPIIVPNDASYSNYASSGMYGNYSSNYPTDSASTLYNINQDHQSQIAHSQEQNNKFLRPATYRGNNTMSSPLSQSHDVESIDNVPALSPTSSSRSRTVLSPLHSKQLASVRPTSPRNSGITSDQMGRAPTYGTSSSAYLQSAMPKLGRTFSDAVQDELYNPDLLAPAEHKTERRNQNSTSDKRSTYQPGHIKSESKHSFPHIFNEAQQQHQQDMSRYHASNQQISRDRSPFRNESRYHPSNTYDMSYDSSSNALPHGPVSSGLDHNQLAMALALREQMRKEAEQASAPKTISPRDSLLEYHEPENSHNQMNLFPSLQSGRMLPPQDDAISNGSMHASSQDGSDMDDFHSMATSRRASMANSSVSSHLDVPRFGYMPQHSAFDSVSAAPYYYSEHNNLATAFPVNDTNSVPYIKEESDYHPIQRPLDTSANTGTYTCTYSGCGHRFTTSTRLQKHRREAHRKAAPSGNSVSTAAAIASRNAQPGPHRCMRTNPSTGKPCNTVFSRPYDLTRHEDTIHNSAKEKVRCEICNDEKTFSRPDALVRHRRVKHGIH